MEKKAIVANDLQTEMRLSLARGFRDFIDEERQKDWGLQVNEITSMKTIRNSTTWKIWCGNQMRRRKQINHYYNRDIKTPEDFISVQCSVLAP